MAEPKVFSRETFEAQYANGQPWPVAITLAYLGGKWKPALLYLVALGIGRFGEMQRRLPGISRTVLTYELRALERDGLLHRETFGEVPPRVEYTLTERGRSCLPILQAMCAWGQQILAEKVAA